MGHVIAHGTFGLLHYRDIDPQCTKTFDDYPALGFLTDKLN